MTIDNEFLTIDTAFNGLYNGLNEIAQNITDIKTMRADLEETGNFTNAYINEVCENETEKRAPAIAAVLDVMSASAAEINTATANILNTADLFEDPRITGAVTVASALTAPGGLSAAAVLVNQFKGNFAALNILASVSKDEKIKQVFERASLTLDTLEGVNSGINEGLTELTAFNIARDFNSLATACYSFNKTLERFVKLYGVDISLDDFAALRDLFEAKQAENIRAAFGLS